MRQNAYPIKTLIKKKTSQNNALGFFVVVKKLIEDSTI